MNTRGLTKEVRLTHWIEVIRRKNESGQTVQAFCAENGLKEARYYYWQSKLRKSVYEDFTKSQNQKLIPASFAKVQLPPVSDTEGRLVIRLNGAEIEIQGELPTSTVEMVLRLLDSR